MSVYAAPLKDMKFVLHELAGLSEVAKLPGCGEATPDTVDAILEEAARFAAEVLDPLNQPGDREGSSLADGRVRTPQGFRDAYLKFAAGGWVSLPFDPDWGGQGLPKLVATPVDEMWSSANMSFSLCPLLSQGAVHALALRGSQALKKTFIPRMVAGEWTGTMNLTEPQAGSDLALVKTRAAREGDHYRISGQKIFITYGEHDFTEQIVHLVLARTPDSPEGVKGISLFIVPKFLPQPDGSPGSRNEVKCVSIEHKLGIHASPTCVLAYGDQKGAIGYLVGEENRGLEYMFTMMNHARLGVGLEGVALAERAYQHALEYAKTRVQGREIGQRSGDRVTIIHHPDVRRMLMSMRARIEAMRALAYFAAAMLDKSKHHPDAQEKHRAQALLDLLTPVVKGWCTEQAVEIASTGIQVHGGMGFVEETGAAQYLRDARIITIYEGTTGIQAGDLVGRKVGFEKGASALAVIAAMRKIAARLDVAEGIPHAMRGNLTEGIDSLEQATRWIVDTFPKDAKAVAAVSVPYLMLFGVVAGGWMMARAALVAQEQLRQPDADREFLEGKLATARFYAEHELPGAASLAREVTGGAASVLALDPAKF